MIIERAERVDIFPQMIEQVEAKRAGMWLRALTGAVVGASLMSLILFVGPLLYKPSDSATTTLKEEPVVGSVAPNFDLEVVGWSERLSLSSLRGKPVWVNFWATWCPPCREEMPEVQRLYEQHRERGLEIVGVDVQESAARVTDFTRELGLTFRFVLDPDGSVVDRYYVSGLPSHFFVDREGVIQAIHVGGLRAMSGQQAPVDEYLQKILGK